MAVKLRLARGGAKKRPYYRIVAADARAPRDGAYIEQLGAYNPMLPKDDSNRVILNGERIAYWLGTGAQPTERVHSFLYKAGLVKDAPVYTETKKATKNPGKYRKDQPKEEAPAAEEKPAEDVAPAADEAPKEEAAAEEKPAEAPAEESKD